MTSAFSWVRLLTLLTLSLSPVRHLAGEEIFIAGAPHGNQTLGHPPVTLDERVWAMKFSADGKELFAVTDNVTRIGWPSRQRQILW